MDKLENYKYKEDLEEIVKIYWSVKNVISDLEDYLKLVVFFALTGILIYVVSSISFVLTSLKIFDPFLIFLIDVGLFAAGELYMINTLRKL